VSVAPGKGAQRRNRGNSYEKVLPYACGRPRSAAKRPETNRRDQERSEAERKKLFMQGWELSLHRDFAAQRKGAFLKRHNGRSSLPAILEIVAIVELISSLPA
jgi:hypothetical protein